MASRATQLTPEEARFWSKVDKRGPDDCWLWLGSLLDNGYGQFRWHGGTLAHRFSFSLAHPDVKLTRTMQVHHVKPPCTDRSCVNPAHLELQTEQDHRSHHSRERARSHREDHKKFKSS